MRNITLPKRMIEEDFAPLKIENGYLENSVWILEGSRIIGHLDSNGKEYYRMELSKYSDLVVKMDLSADGGNEIIYNRMEYSKSSNGINIFIYDKNTGSMVDSVWLDAKNNLGCVR